MVNPPMIGCNNENETNTSGITREITNFRKKEEDLLLETEKRKFLKKLLYTLYIYIYIYIYYIYMQS